MKTFIYPILIVFFAIQINYAQCNIKDCPSCSKINGKTAVSSNTYRGMILDDQTLEPASFASILLKDNLNSYSAMADMDGFFHFNNIPFGDYQVTVSSIGFKSIQKNITIRNRVVAERILIWPQLECLCTCPLIVEPLPGVVDNSVELDADSNSERIEQPTTGYEGHNFIEKPAIVYPNPARDHFNLRSTDPITVIEILNITGEVAVDKTMPINNQVDISTLPAGQYFIRIYFENRKDVQIERMIVVR